MNALTHCFQRRRSAARLAARLAARVLTAAAMAGLWSLPAVRARAQQPGAATAITFVNAPLADVIRSLATRLGVSVVVGDLPDKRITFSSATLATRADLVAALETILENNALVLVRRGSVAQVVAADKAPATGAVGVGFSLGDPPPLGLITQLVPLQSIRAEEAAAAIKQIGGESVRVETVARQNAVLITDGSTRVARYLELLRRLDEKTEGEAGLRTYVVPLKYASAEDLAATLGQLFGLTVAGSRSASLAERSLSRNLDVFRQRENEAFQMRPPAPGPTGPTVAAAGRDSLGRSGLLGQTTVVPDVASNSLIIRTAPPNFPALGETIAALDKRPAQVLFEVTVAEVVLGRGHEFGVDWSAVNKDSSGTASFGQPTVVDSASLGGLVIRAVRLGQINVRAVLKAVASTSTVRVLSTPQLLAANNREAHIVVGSRVPFVASQRLGNDVAIDRNVQFQDVGTTLTVIPTINDDDYVTVQILQEVSSLTSQTIQAALNAPVISTREASTRAVLRNGQTVVIGGLIGSDQTVTETGIPLLMDIPVLGALFKRRSLTNNRTELAIFVTPYVVRTDADADALNARVRDRMEKAGPGVVPKPPDKP